MTDNTKPTGLALMRESFTPNQISKLPKPTSRDATKGRCNECGGWHGLPAVHLDYVGHAAITARLLDADPGWTWEPLASSESGLPMLDGFGGMWIKLTVCGVTRLGYGDAGTKSGPDAIKEVIGDALRNAAMRFGAALELWHKGDLYAEDDAPAIPPAAPAAARPKMSAQAVADHMAAFDECTTLDNLKTAGDKACSIADSMGDEVARAKLAAAYIKRKKAMMQHKETA